VTVLNRSRVLAEALALVSKQDLAALGMRALSTRLGVTPMALYRYVGDAEQLEYDVVAAIVSRLPQLDGSAAFEHVSRAWALGARAVLLEYPGTAQHLLGHWFEIDLMLAQVESLLAAALRSGRRGFQAVADANVVLTYVLMRVEAETAVRRASGVKRALKKVQKDPARFPALHEHLAEYQTARFDEHFAHGLELILHGMEARAR
jgi:AcrR family transcriptional regulator